MSRSAIGISYASRMASPYLDLRRLRYFEAIATAGSLSAAARKLNVAQPALTHQIGELERSIGKPVFTRSSRGVELTAVGRKLLHHTRIVLDQIVTAEVELRELVHKTSEMTTIRIGVSPSISTLTATLVREFAEAFPDIRLNVSEVRTQHCHDMVSQGHLDLAITVGGPNLNGAIPIAWESFYLVRPGPGGKWPPPAMPLKELADIPNLIHAGKSSRVRALVDRKLRQAGMSLDVSIEIDGFTARKQAVIEGLGSTLLPLRAVLRECRDGLLQAYRIVDPPVRRPLVLQSRPGLDAGFVEEVTPLLERLLYAVISDYDGETADA